MGEAVTNHALIRYAERILDIEGLDPASVSNSFVAITAAGYSVEDLRQGLALLLAGPLAAGVKTATIRGVTFKFVDGYLVTVYRGRGTGLTRSNKRHGQRIASREDRAERGLSQRDSRRSREVRP